MTLYFEVQAGVKGNLQSLKDIQCVTPALSKIYGSVAEIMERQGEPGDFKYPDTMRDVLFDLDKMEHSDLMNPELTTAYDAINREFLRTFGINIGPDGVLVSYFDNTSASHTRCEEPMNHATEGECLVMVRKERQADGHTEIYHELYIPDGKNAFKLTFNGKTSKRILDTGIKGYEILHISDLSIPDAIESNSKYWHHAEKV